MIRMMQIVIRQCNKNKKKKVGSKNIKDYLNLIESIRWNNKKGKKGKKKCPKKIKRS